MLLFQAPTEPSKWNYRGSFGHSSYLFLWAKEGKLITYRNRCKVKFSKLWNMISVVFPTQPKCLTQVSTEGVQVFEWFWRPAAYKVFNSWCQRTSIKSHFGFLQTLDIALYGTTIFMNFLLAKASHHLLGVPLGRYAQFSSLPLVSSLSCLR